MTKTRAKMSAVKGGKLSPDAEYAEAVKAHLNESFPEGPPPLVNMMTSDWREVIVEKCKPPRTLKNPNATIAAAVDEWFVSNGYASEGVIYKHAERHAAALQAEAEAQARKRAAEVEPLRAVIKKCVLECLVETGLVEMRPQAKTKSVIKSHRH